MSHILLNLDIKFTWKMKLHDMILIYWLKRYLELEPVILFVSFVLRDNEPREPSNITLQTEINLAFKQQLFSDLI